jgi:6,7-dimethyl-8-ribityllumazine synthase
VRELLTACDKQLVELGVGADDIHVDERPRRLEIPSRCRRWRSAPRPSGRRFDALVALGAGRARRDLITSRSSRTRAPAASSTCSSRPAFPIANGVLTTRHRGAGAARGRGEGRGGGAGRGRDGQHPEGHRRMSAPRRRSREFALQGSLPVAVHRTRRLAGAEEPLGDEGFSKAGPGVPRSRAEGAHREAPRLREQLEPLGDRKWDEVSPSSARSSSSARGSWSLPGDPVPRDDQ